ncbi:ABC transporter ATP-binding protein [Enterococcus villorum]|uniref:ABC transporter ATP-binding protein n=1 Tax=Enterococcus villorum TaxID=112904 RepID=UPI0009C19C06|nr:ATP-binding cassette domain-containing protein [Enterococcus villorum]
MEEMVINHLFFSYEKNIIEDVSLTIPKNAVVKLTGKNGTGKTTFLKILSNLIRSENLAYDLQIASEASDFEAIRKDRLFIPDKPMFQEELNGYENITFYRLLFEYDHHYEQQVLNMCRQLDIENYLNSDVHTLSLGTRQKLFLAINLCVNKELYLLDEPFNSLDEASKKNLMKIILDKKMQRLLSFLMRIIKMCYLQKQSARITG